MRNSGIIRLFSIIFAIFGVVINLTAWAGTTGKIAGIVTDAQTGDPLPGVNVILEGTTMGAATDAEGYYVILNVPPGTYTVMASMIGYERAKVVNVKVRIDLTSRVDFQLTPTAVELDREVVVTAGRPVITRDLTAVEAHIDAERIERLPVQEVAEILNWQSGVTVDAYGGLHIRGGRSSEIAYWIDGVSVTDVYDGSMSVAVENEAIQELQVISGTFNAEYGQAMSGIVNIVTKEGGDQYRGEVTVFLGDYFSPDKETFFNIDDLSPMANHNLQFNLSGPVPFVGKKLSFYSMARYYRTDGWLYGERRFTPQGDTASGEPVSMNWQRKLSGQVKLAFRLNPSMKLSLGLIGSRIDFRDYNHIFRLNPDGDVRKRDRGYNLSLIWTHTLSSRTFYTLNLSNFYREFREYLYKDPTDSRYVHPDSLLEPGYSFLNSGTNMHHFVRSTRTWVMKFDLTSQVTPIHQVKTGVEARYHRLFLDEATIVAKRDESGQEIKPFQPEILDISTPNHDRYRESPVEFSAYVQDKIEYKSMIVNVGLRFDYFHSRGKVLADPEDPNIYEPFKLDHRALSFEERQKIWYKKATPKYQLSPRLGVAYPITDRGVIHFSYGHFLQIPSFLYLYARPGFKVTTSGGIHGVFGNADLKPQRTVMYEIGLQQQLFEDIGIDITGFYRDVRNWVTTSSVIETAIPGVGYTKYINRDYANVRGITLSLNKRFTNNYAFDIEYTFQIAEGSNSDPNEEFFALQKNAEPTRQIIPLDWDQTHTLNASVIVGGKDWGIGLIGKYGTGFPYTPVIGQTTRQGRNLSTGLRKNSRRKPNTYTVDLRAHKNFQWQGLRCTVFLRVFNLFDRRNELIVFEDTGRATYTLQPKNISDNLRRNNTVEEFFKRPDFYSEPREIQIGLEIGF